MKILLLTFWTVFFAGLNVFAQSIDSTDFQRNDSEIVTYTDTLANNAFTDSVGTMSFHDKRDIELRLLNKERISTGVLLDRVYVWKNPRDYYSSADTLNFESCRQIWHQLYSATYNTDSLISIFLADTTVTIRQIDSNVISVGYVNYKYNYIGSNSISDGRLAMNLSVPL